VGERKERGKLRALTPPRGEEVWCCVAHLVAHSLLWVSYASGESLSFNLFFFDQGGRESMQVHLKWWALNGVSGVQWAGTHDVEIADVSAERTNGTDDRMAGTASYQQQGRSKHR